MSVQIKKNGVWEAVAGNATNTSGITESSALANLGTVANATQHDVNLAVDDVIASKVGSKRYVGDFTIAKNTQRIINFHSGGNVFMNLFFEGHNGASCGGVMLSGYNELTDGRVRGIYYIGSASEVIVDVTNYGVIIASPSVPLEVHYEITSTNKPSIETAQPITISSWSNWLYQVTNS